MLYVQERKREEIRYLLVAHSRENCEPGWVTMTASQVRVLFKRGGEVGENRTQTVDSHMTISPDAFIGERMEGGNQEG